MVVTLAGGIRPEPGHRVVAPGPAADPARLPAGAPVAVGPADATELSGVLAELRALVEAGGPVAAGAGADLGAGFRSARTDGGPGDRRDAVLAALAVPGFAERLGPPPVLLAALFGPAATRPLGAATRDTIAAGRRPVLRYAVAAGDLLGPEQLVRLLALDTPEGVDPFPVGLPSVVGAHLGRVLRPLTGVRRLRLLTDLWEQACAAGVARARRERLRAGQRREQGCDDLWARVERFEADQVADRLRAWFGREPTLVEAALWTPPTTLWAARAERVLDDALAATVLARVAVTAVDAGYPEALEQHLAELAAGAARISRRAAAAASRPVVGLSGHPARPGCYVRELHRIATGPPPGRKQLSRVRDLLALARDYGTLALDRGRDLVLQAARETNPEARSAYSWLLAQHLDKWREQVGHFSPERLASWEHGSGSLLPPAKETVGDLFWYAELADALARLRGYPAARLLVDEHGPYQQDEEAPEPEPLVPRLDSIALAAAGTAQLAELGGIVPERPRSWRELVDGLLVEVAAAEAQPGRFRVPEAAEAADGTVLPGTEIRIEVARTGGQLTGWAGYMGNCIAGPAYAEGAAAGRQVLLALRGPDRRILANVEVLRTGKGWRLGEMRARFNDDPDPDLVRGVRAWIATLPAPYQPDPEPPVEPAPPPARRARRPASVVRLTAETGDRLGELAHAVLDPDPLLAALIGAQAGPEALVALRRTSPAILTRACRRLLAEPGAVPVGRLWAASAHRPLSQAVAAMPATVRDKLAPLGDDVPLPRGLRRLARLPRVAPARNAELVAIRVRHALGELLRADAPELAQAMTARPYGPLLRAGVLAVTSWGDRAAGAVTAVTARRRVRVPGYPASSLRDEAWQGAWPDAAELGGEPDRFWTAIAEHGLLVPTSWLGAGDWPVLWARAAR